MRAFSLTAALLIVCVARLPAAEQTESKAVDLTKISRTITEEPDYQGSPRYCLVVLGEQAQHTKCGWFETRVGCSSI